MSVALITGASSGIGRALAEIHLDLGGTAVLVARREDRLGELSAKYGPRAIGIVRDLSVPGSAAALHHDVQNRGVRISLLVNNAGIAYLGPFAQAAELETLVGLNVACVTELMRLFLPAMIQRGEGRILNLASMAAFTPGPMSAAYHASKAYVLALSEAVAHEVRGTGVTVTAACPGATKSELGDLTGLAKSRAFAKPMETQVVAQMIYSAALRGDRVFVPGLWNTIAAWLAVRMPRSVVTKATAKALKPR